MYENENINRFVMSTFILLNPCITRFFKIYVQRASPSLLTQNVQYRFVSTLKNFNISNKKQIAEM